MHSKRQALVALNFGILMMSFAPISAKLIPWPAEIIILGRMVLAAPVLLVFLHVRKISVRISNKELLLMAALGIMLSLHWITYFMSTKVSTVAIALIAVHTHPIFSTFLEPLISRETLNRKHVFLSLVALGGVALMVKNFSLGDSVLQGILLGVFSALLFSLRNIWSKTSVKRHGGGIVMFWQLVFGALFLSPLAFTVDFVPEPMHLTELFLLAVVSTAVAHTLTIASLSQLSARTAGIVSSIQPFYGIVLALILFNEIPSARVLIGGLVVMSVVIAETLEQRRM